ncbi:MAG: isochorismatase family protein [Alphaproteobacteria bacterium]|nr:isochorismatase family protein [Alphaproteobacteria bacterium]
MFTIDKIDVKKLGLVIIDLQRGYCEQGSDCSVKLGWDVHDSELICRAHEPFLEKMRGILPPSRIMWFQTEEHPATMAPNIVYGNFGLEIEYALCVRGTEAYDFHIVHPQPEEPVFQKFHYNGFSSVDFRKYLKSQGIQQLAFTGVVASRCVNATIISAAERGYECIALSDLVGGPAHLKDENDAHMKLTTTIYALGMTSGSLIDRL